MIKYSVSSVRPTYGDLFNGQKTKLQFPPPDDNEEPSLQSGRHLKVVNGQKAALSQFPYQVHLLVTKPSAADPTTDATSYCGGSITILPTIVY